LTLDPVGRTKLCSARALRPDILHTTGPNCHGELPGAHPAGSEPPSLCGRTSSTECYG